MVFCASFVPWLKQFAAADTSWRFLKFPSADCLFDFRVSQRTIPMNKNPQIRPIMGERIMKATTISTVDHFIAASPAAEIPAPASPPISACDEEVGRPKNQVIRFQLIAPIKAPRII